MINLGNTRTIVNEHIYNGKSGYIGSIREFINNIEFGEWLKVEKNLLDGVRDASQVLRINQWWKDQEKFSNSNESEKLIVLLWTASHLLMVRTL